MTFDIKKYITENNDAAQRNRVDEAIPALEPKQSQALQQLRSAGGVKVQYDKGHQSTLAQYSWTPKSNDGFAVQLWNDNGEYAVILMPVEDGDPTGQIAKEYRSRDFKQVLAKTRTFLRQVK